MYILDISSGEIFEFSGNGGFATTPTDQTTPGLRFKLIHLTPTRELEIPRLFSYLSSLEKSNTILYEKACMFAMHGAQ